MKITELKFLGRESIRALIKSASLSRPGGSGNRARRRAGEKVDFKHLKRWSRPSHYIGKEWPEYYVFMGRNRDSDCLANSNFECGLKAIGGEREAEDVTPLVAIICESHWACGWVEWIAIHEREKSTLAKADALLAKLEVYPVLDEDDFSNRELAEADEVWKNCYSEKQRVEYIRNYRSQFEFDSLSDMLAVVRGKWFNGYASELLH